MVVFGTNKKALLHETLPAIARPHWSRSHATAHARVLPVVGLVVTRRTKSASATPSGQENKKEKNGANKEGRSHNFGEEKTQLLNCEEQMTK